MFFSLFCITNLKDSEWLLNRVPTSHGFAIIAYNYINWAMRVLLPFQIGSWLTTFLIKT